MIRPFVLEKKNYLILVFTVVYLAAFTYNGVIHGNIEFLYYTFLLGILIYLVIYLHHQLHLGFFILFNLSVLGFLHLLGGNYYLANGIRLYDISIIPFIFYYDNFIHSYAAFIGTLALYSLFINFLGTQIKKRFPIIALLLVLMALGMGSIVEVVEFFAVVVFGATERVGDYYNNALDLLFNTIGSLLATFVIYFYQYRPKFLTEINGSEKNN